MTTYSTAQPQFVEANGTRYAYLEFGSTAKTDTPLVFLQHFRGTFDHWDPELIDPIAAVRPVILIDYAGVGKSRGTVSNTFTSWARNIIDVIKALNVSQVDLLGFSMGGFTSPDGRFKRPLPCSSSYPRGHGTQRWGRDHRW